MKKQALLFGAGKIGRGFIGQLLFRSGYSMTFVDPVRALVDQLNAAGRYPVSVQTTPPQTDEITGFRAICSGDRDPVIAAVAQHDLFFTAVGGANLPVVGRFLAEGLARRRSNGDVNVLLCENWKNPADDLRQAILQHAPDDRFRAWMAAHLGLVETQVLRPSFDPPPDIRARQPLAVWAQDWWILPCDADAIKGPVPAIQGLEPRPHFRHELIRKVYTYNCMNAVFAYLGWLRGYTFLHEAAFDDDIREIAIGACEESSRGLIAEYGFTPADQEEMKQVALRKYEDKRSPDPIERNARDSRRKLSPEDRLLGPAHLALKHGITPLNLALGVAAAIHYAGSDDAGTKHVQSLLKSSGLRAVIEQCSELKTESTLGTLILDSVPKLERFNRRGVPLAS